MLTVFASQIRDNNAFIDIFADQINQVLSFTITKDSEAEALCQFAGAYAHISGIGSADLHSQLFDRASEVLRFTLSQCQ